MKLTLQVYTISWALGQGPRARDPGPGPKIYTNKYIHIYIYISNVFDKFIDTNEIASPSVHHILGPGLGARGQGPWLRAQYIYKYIYIYIYIYNYIYIYIYIYI